MHIFHCQSMVVKTDHVTIKRKPDSPTVHLVVLYPAEHPAGHAPVDLSQSAPFLQNPHTSLQFSPHRPAMLQPVERAPYQQRNLYEPR